MLRYAASLQICDFGKDTPLYERWREEAPVNVICTVTNDPASFGIQPPPKQIDSTFLHITTADKSQSGLYCLRSRPLVFNTTHLLEFDYLLRATGEPGETNIKVFADINTDAAYMLSFYQVDTNNQWESGNATIGITQPQSKVEVEIRVKFQNDGDFVAIDNIRISELLPITTPMTTLTHSTLPTTTTRLGSSNLTSRMEDAILSQPASSQGRHSYSTLLIIICICLSVLGSTLGMTLLLKRCYINKEESYTSSKSSFSN